MTLCRAGKPAMFAEVMEVKKDVQAAPANLRRHSHFSGKGNMWFCHVLAMSSYVAAVIA